MDLRYSNKIFIILSFLTISSLLLYFIYTKNQSNKIKDATHKKINFIKMKNEKLKEDYLLVKSNYTDVKEIVYKQNLKPKSLSEKLLEINAKKNMILNENPIEIDKENKESKKSDTIERSKSLSEKLLNIDANNSSKNLNELFIKEKPTDKLENIELINSIPEKLLEIENKENLTSKDVFIEDKNVIKNVHTAEEAQVMPDKALDIKAIKKIIPIENFNELFEADKSQKFLIN